MKYQSFNVTMVTDEVALVTVTNPPFGVIDALKEMELPVMMKESLGWWSSNGVYSVFELEAFGRPEHLKTACEILNRLLTEAIPVNGVVVA